MSAPDGCPWHDQAQREPNAVVHVLDGQGRYVGQASVEIVCSSYHVQVFIDAALRRAFDAARRSDDHL